MKKTNKKVDIIIIAILVIAIAFTGFFSVIKKDDGASKALDSVSLEDYANSNIGVLSGSSQDSIIKQAFPNCNEMYFDSIPDMFYALSIDKVDACAIDKSIISDYMKEYDTIGYVEDALATTDYATIFQKNNKNSDKILNEYNQFLSKIKADGTMAELESIWIDQKDERKLSVDKSGLTGENGTLTFATCSTTKPFDYIKDGDLVGYDVDIAYRFAKEYGYNLDIVDCQFNSIVSGIQSGKYDFASCAITVTDERKESLAFSDPNYVTDVVLAINNAPNSLASQNNEKDNKSFILSVKDKFQKTFVNEARWKLVLQGVLTTLLITIASTVLGLILAFLICMLRRTGSRVANVICNIYVRLLQGTPMVVLLMIMYYIVFGSSNLNPLIPAIIGFTLNLGAYGSEMMKSGIEGVNDGQREAALALGYTENQAFFKFIFPQAAQRFLPVLKGEIVSLLKGTSVVGYIAIQDLTKMSDIIRSQTYEALFPLITTALIYMLLSWTFIALFGRIEFNFNPKRKSQKKQKRSAK